ncbi:hypothetical protein V8G54_002534 [Vigna mungo]|uniref:Uncharacterized protein n=1 Tax=Vigna mungo TaxID=3915 RepID=A0AAQ3PAZ0_VIGMU
MFVIVVLEKPSSMTAVPAERLSGRRTVTASTERERRRAQLPPSMRRNCAASAPQWRAISRPVACQTARSLEARAVGPGMRRWSLRSLTKRKIRRQQAEPIAEMFSR